MIPYKILNRWEREAISLGVPRDELRDFLKVRENEWRESHSKTPAKKQPREFWSWSQDERICKRAVWEFDDLLKRFRKGFKDENAKQNFIAARDWWFSHLLRVMREMNISKGKLAYYGLDFRAAQNLAHAIV